MPRAAKSAPRRPAAEAKPPSEGSPSEGSPSEGPQPEGPQADLFAEAGVAEVLTAPDAKAGAGREPAGRAGGKSLRKLVAELEALRAVMVADPER